MTQQTSRLIPFLMRVVLVVSLAGVVTLWLIATNGQSRREVEYFSPTGHNVTGEFLQFFRSRGGLEIFGYPITEAVNERGQIVQYFQRARMELYPSASPGTRVRLSPLASMMNNRTPPIAASQKPSPTDTNQRYYPETGHIVGFNFLSFFDARGGVATFGYPITEYFAEGDRFVQYFERARLEYYPDQSLTQRVQIAPLGEIYFDYAGLDPLLRRPVAAILDREATAYSLKVIARVEQPYVAYPGRQTLHVYVTDSLGRDLPGMKVDFRVGYPAGERKFEIPTLTDDKGHVSFEFDLEPEPVGRYVVVGVTARQDGLTVETETFFTYWR